MRISAEVRIHFTIANLIRKGETVENTEDKIAYDKSGGVLDIKEDNLPGYKPVISI